MILICKFILKDGRLIMESNKTENDRVTFEQDHIIKFKSLNSEDGGDYTITASNDAGL